jgi:hypothetical protein
VREDGQDTAAFLIDLAEARPARSFRHASEDMVETVFLFAQMRLGRKWRAEVADGLRLKILGANWDPA